MAEQQKHEPQICPFLNQLSTLCSAASVQGPGNEKHAEWHVFEMLRLGILVEDEQGFLHLAEGHESGT